MLFRSGSSVRMAEKAGGLLDEMVPNIQRTSDLVQEISAASLEQSLEQSSATDQINNAMSQLNKATQQNASASEQLAATSEEMSAQADQLQALMGFFQLEGSASGKSARSARPAQAKLAAAPRSPSAAVAFKPAAQVSEQDFERF